MTSARTKYSFGLATDVIKTSWRQCLTWKRHEHVLGFLCTDHHCWCNICIVYRYFLSHTARRWRSVYCLATGFDLAYRSSSGRLYKNNNLLYILYAVCTFCMYFNAVRCDVLPHDTVSVYIPVRAQSAWWWPICEVETSSQTINWSQSIDTHYVSRLFNDLLLTLYCNFSSTLFIAVNCTKRSIGRVQIAKFEVVVALFGGFEDPLSSETSRKTGIRQADIVCYEYFQIPIVTRGEVGEKRRHKCTCVIATWFHNPRFSSQTNSIFTQYCLAWLIVNYIYCVMNVNSLTWFFIWVITYFSPNVFVLVICTQLFCLCFRLCVGNLRNMVLPGLINK